MHQGLFIAIEGSDGSGKGTQIKLLVERLKAEGFEVSTYDFPQYEKESSYYIREYLNGTYGTTEETGPYTPSLFYALDRFSVAKSIREDIAAGRVVISNRFSGSNMAHQGAKFDNPEDRAAFFTWLDQLEFGMLQMPRPDLNLVLLVPADIAQQLVDQKGKRSYTKEKRDLHEADLDHLKRSIEAYEQLCQTFPENFVSIDCAKNGELMSIPTVNNLIWERIWPMFGKLRRQKKTNDTAATDADSSKQQADPINSTANFSVPEGLDEKTGGHFSEQMQHILAKRTELLQNISLEGERHERAAVATTLLPVVATQATLNQTAPVIDELVEMSDLQPIKGNGDKTVILADYWPKNELNLLAQLFYSHSSLGLEELGEKISQWSYEQKETAFKNLLLESSPTLRATTYTFDIISSYEALQIFQQAAASLIEYQQLTPHYGYETPEIVSSSAQDGLFEECFELSLKLYCHLLEAGYPHQAQYAILCGHKARWKLTLNSSQLHALIQFIDDHESKEQTKELSNLLKEHFEEVHPLISNLLS